MSIRIQNMKNPKDKGIVVRVSREERKMLDTLKNKHFVNISAMFRQSVKDIYNKLEGNNENNQVKQV